MHGDARATHQLDSQLNRLRGIRFHALLLNPDARIVSVARVADKVSVCAVRVGLLRFIADCASNCDPGRQVNDVGAAD